MPSEQPVSAVSRKTYAWGRMNSRSAALNRATWSETEVLTEDAMTKTCVSILFVGYILMQVPSNAILNKIGRPAAYLTACMAVWVSKHAAILANLCASAAEKETTMQPSSRLE